MDYDDVLEPRAKKVIPQVEAERDLVLEECTTDFCGAVVHADKHAVTLEDRHLRRRMFPYETAGFRLDGELVTVIPPRGDGPAQPTRTASGSLAAPGQRARVARAARILVEGVHDAALVERVWGDDLRHEGVVVEVLDGVDHLPAALTELRPARDRRVGVLVDHLVPGSKETRLVSQLADRDVLVLGHPYVDVWQAVKPAALGIAAWPVVPRGLDWKQGVCDALGVAGPREMWRRVLAAVDSYADLEVPLLQSVEQLIDFVTG
jgi:hypothetical protein